MNILITGGTGFISSHIVKSLLASGHSVTTISRSGKFAIPLTESEQAKNLRIVKAEITDRAALEQEFSKADALIHNASAVGAQGAQRLNSAYIDTNIGGANNVADVLSNCDHSIKNVIVGSSISVYGEGNYICARCGSVRPQVRRKSNWKESKGWNPHCPQCAGPIEPAATPENAAKNGKHLYAITKKYQEDLLAFAATNAEIPLTIFRYATVYGPGQRRQNPYMQMLTRLSCGVAPIIFEDGHQTRDFIEVGDVVRANIMALNSCYSGVRVYNIGSGVPRSMIDFVNQLCSTYAKKAGVEAMQPEITMKLAEGDVRHCTIDCREALNALGFQVQVSMHDGIERFIDWLISNNIFEKDNALNSKI